MLRLFFAVLFVLTCLFPVTGNALTLTWDRNTETDLKEYEIYTCTPNPTCTIQQVAASRIGVVPQTAIGILPTFVLPPGTEGKVAVSASDTAGNESGLSVAVPFDGKAPLVPVNPRIAP